MNIKGENGTEKCPRWSRISIKYRVPIDSLGKSSIHLIPCLPWPPDSSWWREQCQSRATFSVWWRPAPLRGIFPARTWWIVLLISCDLHKDHKIKKIVVRTLAGFGRIWTKYRRNLRSKIILWQTKYSNFLPRKKKGTKVSEHQLNRRSEELVLCPFGRLQNSRTTLLELPNSRPFPRLLIPVWFFTPFHLDDSTNGNPGIAIDHAPIPSSARPSLLLLLPSAAIHNILQWLVMIDELWPTTEPQKRMRHVPYTFFHILRDLQWNLHFRPLQYRNYSYLAERDEIFVFLLISFF